MLPDPLHPAVVHFPMALAVLGPISVLIAVWAIRRGAHPRRAWAIPVTFVALMALTGWVAMETGEDEEEAVEQVVAEEPLHEHEEAAERFVVFSGVLALVALTGLLGGTVGAAGRVVTLAGSVVTLVAGVQVGSLGGELVYEHGAADAYVKSGVPGGAVPSGAGASGGASEHEEGDEEEHPEGGEEAGRAGGAEARGRTRVALPGLFTVMAGLQDDMARVTRGIWTENLDSVAAAARRVADHPTIPPVEVARIADILGSDMSRFKSFDTRVHDLAVELAEHAAAGDLGAVLSTEARLRQGCVDCHSTFRERIRDGVR